MSEPFGSAEQLDALQALADAATPGPWFATKSETEPNDEFRGLGEPDRSKWTVSPHVHIAGWRHDGGYGGYGITERNAAFIAAARQAVPRLIKAYRELLKQATWLFETKLKHAKTIERLRAENEALDNDLTKMSAEYVRWRDECRRIALERDALRAQVERLENVEHEFVLKFADKDAELARAEGEIDRLEEALKFLRAVQEEQIRSCVGDYDFANENSKLRLENTSLKAEMARLVLAREGE